MCERNSELNGPNTRLMLFWTLIVLVSCKLWAPKSTKKHFVTSKTYRMQFLIITGGKNFWVAMLITYSLIFDR